MSETNIEAARRNMVVSQIRTGDVQDERLLALLERAPREAFVPDGLRNMAFADMLLPLGHGEVMMAPLTEARLLQALAIKPTDKVLEIGTGSGYVSWLLANLGQKVHSVEIVPEFTQRASEKLAAQGVRNVELEIGDGARGWERHAPYDVIFITGSLPLLPESFNQSLAPGGRLAVILGQAPVMQATLIARQSTASFRRTALFETELPPLRNALAPERFTF